VTSKGSTLLTELLNLTFRRRRNPSRTSHTTESLPEVPRVHLEGVGSEPLQDHPELRHLVAGWAVSWDLPGLEKRLDISFNTRFRTSLGRCIASEGRIRLASFLVTGPTELLHEALCHEAAHAAVHELHAGRRRPHGPEWRSLMRAAAFEPRARIPADLLPDLPSHRVPRGFRWEYRCPVCDASRLARRRVDGWRCTACRAAGLEGTLSAMRVDAPPRRESARATPSSTSHVV